MRHYPELDDIITSLIEGHCTTKNNGSDIKYFQLNDGSVTHEESEVYSENTQSLSRRIDL